MAGNSFGTAFRITTFGESHGAGIGVVIDGCPAGLLIDEAFIQQQLARRRPGQSSITSPRKEDDNFEILSGVYNNESTGAPLTLFIRNKDQKSADYDHLKDVYRPGHADLTYDQKYGHRDHRGGGRSSARETAARVAAGSIAQLLLRTQHIQVAAIVSQVGNIRIEKDLSTLDFATAELNPVRCPDSETADKMIRFIEQVRDAGDTIGGTITCRVTGMIPGLGEPVFDKLQASLAHAMLSINAAKGFDYGSGFDSLSMKGSQLNDPVLPADEQGKVRFASNHAGGVQGGISTGQDLIFRVAFKPVSTLKMTQQTINKSGEAVNLSATGRHDPCVLPRAVPIVEAMAALVLADHLLLARLSKL